MKLKEILHCNSYAIERINEIIGDYLNKEIEELPVNKIDKLTDIIALSSELLQSYEDMDIVIKSEDHKKKLSTIKSLVDSSILGDDHGIEINENSEECNIH